jgi:hypothetical protein
MRGAAARRGILVGKPPFPVREDLLCGSPATFGLSLPRRLFPLRREAECDHVPIPHLVVPAL